MLSLTPSQQCDLASLERGHFHSREEFTAVERKQKSEGKCSKDTSGKVQKGFMDITWEIRSMQNEFLLWFV